jgi:histidinol-phosphate/aromatic aminotransferase/cobyric acid decarboxylase-like protein
LRLGYGIAHPEFIAALEKIRQPFNINSLAQAAGLAALDDRNTSAKRANNFKGRKFLEKALRSMNVPFVPSSANFVLAKVGAGPGGLRAIAKAAASLRGPWAAINCRNGFASPSARRRKTALRQRAAANSARGQK